MKNSPDVSLNNKNSPEVSLRNEKYPDVSLKMKNSPDVSLINENEKSLGLIITIHQRSPLRQLKQNLNLSLKTFSKTFGARFKNENSFVLFYSLVHFAISNFMQFLQKKGSHYQ